MCFSAPTAAVRNWRSLAVDKERRPPRKTGLYPHVVSPARAAPTGSRLSLALRRETQVRELCRPASMLRGWTPQRCACMLPEICHEWAGKRCLREVLVFTPEMIRLPRKTFHRARCCRGRIHYVTTGNPAVLPARNGLASKEMVACPDPSQGDEGAENYWPSAGQITSLGKTGIIRFAGNGDELGNLLLACVGCGPSRSDPMPRAGGMERRLLDSSSIVMTVSQASS